MNVNQSVFQKWKSTIIRPAQSLQGALWIGWTLLIVSTAFWLWWHALIKHHSFNELGMIVHCLLIGTIGLVIVTLIEMRFEPERFARQHEPYEGE